MQEEITRLLSNNCVIVFDTNIFLNIYEYSPQVADFLVTISERIVPNMVLPYTVKREFDKNHKECHGRQTGKFNNVPKKLKQHTTQMRDKLAIQFGILKGFQFPDIDMLQAESDKKVNEIEEMFEQYVDEHNIFDEINSKFLNEDKVHKLVQDLVKSGKLLNGFGPDELYNICEEGEKRYKRNTPPGFEDGKTKTGIQMYNDLIIWKEVLRFCSENQKDLIFVTDDVKKDWWEIVNTQRVSFRTELQKEFEAQTGRKMIGLTSGELFSCLSEIFKIEAPNTAECVLGYDIENYIDRVIDDGLIEDIIGELGYTGENFVDIVSLSHYDGSYFDFAEEAEATEVLGYEFGGYVDGKALYYLTIDVKVKANSSKYSGRDSDTRDVILSDERTHILHGKIVVEVTREVDSYIDQLTDDYSYSKIKIMSGELAEEESYTGEDLCVECGVGIGDYPHYNGGLVCESCAAGNSRGEICPQCGQKVPFEYMAGNGFCSNCTEKYDL